MKRDRKRELSPRDISEAEIRYLATGDSIYVALAIGSNPIEPPIWAMEAAAALARDVRANANIGNDRKLRGARLDAMVREYFRHYDLADRTNGYSPPSLRTVIRKVLSDEGITSESSTRESIEKGLIQAWNEEAEGFEIDPQGVPENARRRRMIGEWGDKQTGKPWFELIDHWWKIERLQVLSSRNGKN